MKEKDKIREARYFYSKMVETQEDRDVFKFNLSAFLSSARSVMQFASAEAEGKRGGQKWYSRCMSSNPILSFFKDKRDFNVHVSPIAPRKDMKVEITDVVGISESVHIELRDKDGNLKEVRAIQEKSPQVMGNEPSVRVETRYGFKDWSGSEDVIELCEKYIRTLEDVVQDGLKRRFITEANELKEREFIEMMEEKAREHAAKLVRAKIESRKKQWRASWWWQLFLVAIGAILGLVGRWVFLQIWKQ